MQKTADEMRISAWSSDVCSSDLFAQAVRALPQVMECFLVAGDVDYFLKIRVHDLAAFNRFHSEKILALPGVRQVRTFFVLDEIKRSEERRVGKECVSTYRSRWSLYH